MRSLHGDDGVTLPSVFFSKRSLLKFASDVCNGAAKPTSICVWKVEGGSRAWKIQTKISSDADADEVMTLLGEDSDASIESLASSPCAVAGSTAASIVLTSDWVIQVAFVNQRTKKIGFFDFCANPASLLHEIDVFVVQQNVTEVFLSFANAAEPLFRIVADKIKKKLTEAEVPFSEVPAAAASLSDDSLKRLLQPASNGVFVCNEAAAAPIRLLFCALALDADDANLGKFALVKMPPNVCLQLDRSAFASLHLFPTAGSTNRSSSLFGTLNYCRTAQGAALLAEWIRQPLLEEAAINARLDLVGCFVENAAVRSALHEELLRSMPDLFRVVRRLQKNTGSLQDAVKMYDVVMLLPKIADTLAACQNATLDAQCVTLARDLFSSFSKYIELLDSTVDWEAIKYHEYVIKPQLNEELLGIKAKKQDILAQIEHEYQRAICLVGGDAAKKIKLERNSVYGYFFRVTRSDSVVIRDHAADFVELATLKNGVHFATTPLRTLSVDFDECSREYAVKQQSIVRELMKVVASYAECALNLNAFIAFIDATLSLSMAASSSVIPYVRPTIVASEEALVLRGCRHPCVELQEGVGFIPNDVILDHVTNETMLITGPNMGGKSTYIRQVALCVLMAQIGSFVPAAEAQVPIFTKILTRIGANDQMNKGISTFMLEMVESANILQHADRHSLVVIDELGRGTSTHDGFGLAWAIAHELAESRHCRTLFASHFHEITLLATRLPAVCNFHMAVEAVDDSLVFLYSVLPGVCERSFGIHVARICNFPDAVVELASLKAAELEKNSAC